MYTSQFVMLKKMYLKKTKQKKMKNKVYKK